MADPIRAVRIAGEMTFAQAVDDVDACIRQAREDGVRRLLVDLRGMSGFVKPDVVARLGMVRRWAATAQSRVKVAFVSPAELNDGERFDVVLARSLAFEGDVFEQEEDARYWLEQTPSLWTGSPPAF